LRIGYKVLKEDLTYDRLSEVNIACCSQMSRQSCMLQNCWMIAYLLSTIH